MHRTLRRSSRPSVPVQRALPASPTQCQRVQRFGAAADEGHPRCQRSGLAEVRDDRCDDRVTAARERHKGGGGGAHVAEWGRVRYVGALIWSLT